MKLRNKQTDSFITAIYAKLLPVQIILVAIQSVNGIIDGVIGSRLLGSNAMSAVGLFSPLLSLLYAIACVIIVGSQVLGARTKGQGDSENTNKIFSFTIYLMTIVGIIFGLIILVFSKQFAVLLKGDELLRDYLRGVAFSYVFDALCAILAEYLQLIGNTKRTYAGFIMLIASNTALNIFFIRHLSLGVFGLGLATTISTLLTFIIMITKFFNIRTTIHFQKAWLPVRDIVSIFRFGSSAATFNIVLALKSFVLNYIVLAIGGTLALGVMSVENAILGLLGAISMGIGNTTLTIGSVFYGEKDKPALKSVFRVSMKLGLIMSTSIAILIMVFASPISYIFYGNEQEARLLMVDILLLSSMFIPLNVASCVFNKLYHIQGKMLLTNILSFLENGLLIVIALVLSYPFGLNGVWISLPLADLLLIVCLIVYSFVRNRKVSFKLDDMLLFNDELKNDNSVFVNMDANNFTSQIGKYIEDEEVKRIIESITDYKLMNLSISDSKIKIRTLNENCQSSYNSRYEISEQSFLGIKELNINLR